MIGICPKCAATNEIEAEQGQWRGLVTCDQCGQTSSLYVFRRKRWLNDLRNAWQQGQNKRARQRHEREIQRQRHKEAKNRADADAAEVCMQKKLEQAELQRKREAWNRARVNDAEEWLTPEKMERLAEAIRRGIIKSKKHWTAAEVLWRILLIFISLILAGTAIAEPGIDGLKIMIFASGCFWLGARRK